MTEKTAEEFLKRPKKSYVMLRFTAEEKAALTAIAKAQNTNTTKLIYAAIQFYLQHLGKQQ